MDPQETSTCIKHSRELEKGRYKKKSKATKTSLDPITLTEDDLYDIGDTVRDVTGLQELQTCASQAGTVSTSLAVGTSEAADMLRMKASSVIVLLDGALTTKNEVERPTLNALKGVGLNLAALLREALHLLQDGVFA